ncbi:hypothetical protein AArcSl_0189 [Halalkaliarchaeum desulfuricum]|uniref:Uncharacterized protein n=1 Tax=Halalkaliarchaeum desulfuricum TaxID=2055893 RepID=A0A343TFH2_9EURY|nr:hypothetical protein [Halalkaliarchaeum desulfuricum]AUX07844.1 hypothetical protein AArcSl_0189 [Halalkaliarchaeum desulfuricum]
MTLVDTRKIGRRFRALDADERLEFLAALWAARGFETTIQGEVIVASRDGDEVRIGATAGSRIHRLYADIVARISGSERGTQVDVLVDAFGDRSGFSSPRNDSVRRLAPTELRQLLAYGVDRETGDRLAREYLETPLVVEESTQSPVGSAVASPAVVALVVLAIAVVVVSLSGVGLPGDPFDAREGPATSGGASTTTWEDSASADASARSEVTEDDRLADRNSSLPPGLSLSGVEDATRLAHAHRRSLPTSRTFEMAFEGPPDVVGYQGLVVTSTTWEAETSIRYRGATSATLANEDELHERGTDVFADGDREYIRIHEKEIENGVDDSGNETTGPGEYTYRDFQVGTFLSPTDTPSATRIPRYLDSNATRVEVATERTETRYVVFATEPPASLPDTVESYRARAIVRPDGVVLRLEVTYERSDVDRSVRYTQRVSKLDRTTVSPPAWVESAREEPDDR